MHYGEHRDMNRDMIPDFQNNYTIYKISKALSKQLTFALDMRNLTARSWHMSEALYNNSWILFASFPSSKSVNFMSSFTLKMIKNRLSQGKL